MKSPPNLAGRVFRVSDFVCRQRIPPGRRRKEGKQVGIIKSLRIVTSRQSTCNIVSHATKGNPFAQQGKQHARVGR